MWDSQVFASHHTSCLEHPDQQLADAFCLAPSDVHSSKLKAQL